MIRGCSFNTIGFYGGPRETDSWSGLSSRCVSFACFNFVRRRTDRWLEFSSLHTYLVYVGCSRRALLSVQRFCTGQSCGSRISDEDNLAVGIHFYFIILHVRAPYTLGDTLIYSVRKQAGSIVCVVDKLYLYFTQYEDELAVICKTVVLSIS